MTTPHGFIAGSDLKRGLELFGTSSGETIRVFWSPDRHVTVPALDDILHVEICWLDYLPMMFWWLCLITGSLQMDISILPTRHTLWPSPWDKERKRDEKKLITSFWFTPRLNLPPLSEEKIFTETELITIHEWRISVPGSSIVLCNCFLRIGEGLASRICFSPRGQCWPEH